jgi:hypothetical protein
MQEREVVPLSRFGRVEWLHELYLMSVSDPKRPVSRIRMGRNGDCDDDYYIVAVTGGCSAPVDMETGDLVDGWAVYMPLPQYLLQIIKRIRSILVSDAWWGCCEYLLPAMAGDPHFLDVFLGEVEDGHWNGVVRLKDEPPAQAA